MLKKLIVKDFAIIEDLTVEFNNGMTVLTGQTGAGKSLIIDSISLLLGQRSDSDMIRYGKTKASIEGTFTYSNKAINSLLENNNIKINNDLVISREITKSRSSAKINECSVSIQILKEISNYLADIHVQHDTYALFNQNTYLSLIDKTQDDKFLELYNNYQIDYTNYLDEYKKYEHILNSSKESKDKLEYIEFTYNEISKMNLEVDEDIKIEESINKLKNFDKIYNSLKNGINNLENDYFSIDNIYLAYKELEHIKDYDSSYLDTYNKMEEAYYNIKDSLSDMKDYIEGLDYDEDELDKLNERINQINNLKVKYHKDLNTLIQYQEELKLELSMINNYDEVLKDEEDKLKKRFDKALKSAEELSKYRKNKCKIIEKDIVALCKDLELPHTVFEIKFLDLAPSDYKNKLFFKENGIDTVDFMLSTNLGEPVLPLSRVASGGELSRIMLAFKTYFAKESNLSLLIFDEIDSGVSGSVAYEIAKKMKEISKISQVLAITHLPQVAAIADFQYYIYKDEKNGRTFTNVNVLEEDSRAIEIAHMISGEKVSKYALEAAKEMLQAK